MASRDWVDWNSMRSRYRKWNRFSWLTLRSLVSSMNDVIGKAAPGLVNDMRGRWIARQRAVPRDGRWSEDFVIPMTNARSFLVLGDPGEQDASQFAVVPPLLTQQDAGFMVICSDVIYPAGDVNEYVEGFYVPYRDFKKPIFALPGNHDWYDGLNGFMWHFCGAEPLPPDQYRATSYSVFDRLARRLWRRAWRPKRDVLNAWRNHNAVPEGEPWRARQPGPYWAIETKDLLVVAIDTGIKGELDRDQADWLVRVSRGCEKPKVLLTGKPLLVDFKHEPCFVANAKAGPNAEFTTVDAVVRHPPFRYVAAIGGDIHNYQHYRTKAGAKGRLDYFVSGGGGAYTSATHAIPPCEQEEHAGHCGDLGGLTVEDFKCYPDRAESLAFYGGLLVPRVWRLVLNVIAALAGLAGAATVGLLVEPGNDTLEWTLAGLAAALAIELFGISFGRGPEARTQPSLRRARLALLLSLTTGAVLGLTGWWLTGDDFDRCVLAAAILIGGGGMAGALLRRLPPRAWASGRAQAIAYGVQAALALAIILVLVPGSARDEVWALIAGALLLPAGVVLLALGMRKAITFARRFWLVAGSVVALAGAALIAVLAVNDAGWVNAVATGYATIVALALVPLGFEYLRQLFPDRHPYVVTGLLAGLVGVGALAMDHHWAPEAAVAALALVMMLLLGTLVAHLVFLKAHVLLWRPGTRCGNLSPREAREAIAWRSGGERPRSGRVRRVTDLVHPGKTDPAHPGTQKPNGPLQRKVSEIFDADHPPFYKSFLRLDAEGGELVVRCVGVTGLERGPDDVTVVDEVAIPYPPPVSGAVEARSAPSGS